MKCCFTTKEAPFEDVKTLFRVGDEAATSHFEGTEDRYLSCFLMISDGLLGVDLRFLHVVGRLHDVIFDPVHHLSLKENFRIRRRW